MLLCKLYSPKSPFTLTVRYVHLVPDKHTSTPHLSPPAHAHDTVYCCPASGRLTSLCIASRDCKKSSSTTPTSLIGHFIPQKKKKKDFFPALVTCIITVIFHILFVVLNSFYILSPTFLLLPPLRQSSSCKLSLSLFTVIFWTHPAHH